MATEADIIQRIADLEAILASGISSRTQDGETVTFDRDDIRRTIRELKSQLPSGQQGPRTRTIDLSGSF